MIIVISLSLFSPSKLHKFHPYAYIIKKQGKTITPSPLEISFPSVFHIAVRLKSTLLLCTCFINSAQLFTTLHPLNKDLPGGLRRVVP